MKKTGGRKSRDTLPLSNIFTYVYKVPLSKIYEENKVDYTNR